MIHVDHGPSHLFQRCLGSTVLAIGRGSCFFIAFFFFAGATFCFPSFERGLGVFFLYRKLERGWVRGNGDGDGDGPNIIGFEVIKKVGGVMRRGMDWQEGRIVCGKR